MANTLYAHAREAIRVKVKKCEPNLPPEWRKFSVDPQITSLEVLYSLLAKAFDIKSDFSIKYKAFDPAGNEIYLPVLSDWDLDAAFLRIHNLSIQTATEPCLILQIDIKPFTEIKEWDAETPSSTSNMSAILSGGGVEGNTGSNSIAGVTTIGAREIMSPLQQSLGASQKYVQNMQTKLPGLIMNHMEKTFSIVQKAFNLSEETMSSLPPRAPLSDNEFRLFLDAVGQIQRSDELRKVIFFGGIDPSLRRVVWKHILNVYPNCLNGHQRMDFMRRKSEHYYKLRDVWKTAVKQGCVVGELSYVTSMVKKDVLRTDRLHPFYAGSDDNQNIASLFNILTTFALNHPSVSYCQGMSDIASPLLVTMNDEAQAYICFCAIMTRVRGNFMIDGIAMTQKFAHLTEALSFYDPEFWDYLKSQQADDLLFCYRWLLLELKREFPFEDALRMLEVQWSSLKYETALGKELYLYEKEFVPIMETSAPTTSSSFSGSLGTTPISPSYLLAKPRENPYTKVCALRRQSSSASLSSLSSSYGSTCASALDNTKRLNQSLDDNISRHSTRRHRHASSKAHQSLDESKMLMLMESVEYVKGPDNIVQPTTDHSENNETGDDEVFGDITNSNNEMNHFNFHHTNPFKEDAQVSTHVVENTAKTKLTQQQSDAQRHLVALSHTNSSDSTSAVELESSIDRLTLKSKSNPIPKSIAKLHNQNIISNYNAVSNIIAKQISNTSSASSGTGGGHFKDLKEKIAATSRRGMLSDENEKSQQKLVKNFNEFLNFANMNKSRIADRFASVTTATSTTPNTNNANTNVIKTSSAKDESQSPSPTHGSIQTLYTTTAQQTGAGAAAVLIHPLVQFAKSDLVSSLDESDSSSVPDTTWSGSTAATAIQQTNNLSSNSLHLELNSTYSSMTHTPERTPTFERKTPALTGEKLLNSSSSITDLASQRQLSHDPSLTPDDSQDQEYYPMTTAITRELRLEAENLDRQVFGDPADIKATPNNTISDIEYEKLDKDSLDLVEDLKENEIIKCPDLSELLIRRRNREAKAKSTIEPINKHHLDFDVWEHGATACKRVDDNRNFDEKPVLNTSRTTSVVTQRAISLDLPASKVNPFIDENILIDAAISSGTCLPNSSSLPEVILPISTDTANALPVELATNASDEIAFIKSPQCRSESVNGATTTPVTPPMLPPPTEFGGGNPFLMFLCLTLLLQHRNTIMKTGMDYNEIAMHFDKMVRKHDVTHVLNEARRMYIDYLKTQNAYKQRLQAANKTANNVNRNSNIKTSTQLQQQGRSAQNSTVAYTSATAKS